VSVRVDVISWVCVLSSLSVCYPTVSEFYHLGRNVFLGFCMLTSRFELLRACVLSFNILFYFLAGHFSPYCLHPDRDRDEIIPEFATLTEHTFEVKSYHYLIFLGTKNDWFYDD
jgi:hypothetical protein